MLVRRDVCKLDSPMSIGAHELSLRLPSHLSVYKQEKCLCYLKWNEPRALVYPVYKHFFLSQAVRGRVYQFINIKHAWIENA